jgi:hypothetical protein
MAVTDEMRSVLAVKFEVILPHLDERQRRAGPVGPAAGNG